MLESSQQFVFQYSNVVIVNRQQVGACVVIRFKLAQSLDNKTWSQNVTECACNYRRTNDFIIIFQ